VVKNEASKPLKAATMTPSARGVLKAQNPGHRNTVPIGPYCAVHKNAKPWPLKRRSDWPTAWRIKGAKPCPLKRRSEWPTAWRIKRRKTLAIETPFRMAHCVAH
jgi:hypothetical protein